MKPLINNHVHGSQLASVNNNSFSVIPETMTGYGILPKYEVAPSYSIVIEYEPRGGLRGLIFSSLRYFRPSRMLEVHSLCSETESVQWKTLFPWHYTLGWIVHGCRIRNERTDTMTICHCANAGERIYHYEYDICITATVDPKLFYSYMKTEENAVAVQISIQNCVRDIIASEIKMQAGNAAFVLHTHIFSPDMEKAGYRVSDCRIQYKRNV